MQKTEDGFEKRFVGREEDYKNADRNEHEGTNRKGEMVRTVTKRPSLIVNAVVKNPVMIRRLKTIVLGKDLFQDPFFCLEKKR